MSPEQLSAALNDFPEVKWDRMLVEPGLTRVYGWLPRDDGRSDFVLLGFHGDLEDGEDEDYEMSFVTSSDRYSHAFAVRFFGSEAVAREEHRPCQRVEDVLGDRVPGAIRL